MDQIETLYIQGSRLTMRLRLTLSVIGVIFSTAITGCMSAPTRSQESEFLLLQQGKIDSKDINKLLECLTDGFDKSHDILTNVHIRQQRRAAGYRVEAMVHSSVLVSADIFDSGIVELHEVKRRPL